MKPKPPPQKKEPCLEPCLELCPMEVLSPLILVLLGHTGVGKSASGNTILHKPAFESRRAFRSVTQQISVQSGTVAGQEVHVVDTPGIMDAQVEEQVRAMCENLRKSRKPHVFLFIVKIDRFTAEQEEAVNRAMRAAGDHSRGFLLFTGADILGTMTLGEFINDDPENPLCSLAQEFGDRIHMFNNSVKNQEEKQRQVLELMEKIRTIKHEVCPVAFGAEQILQTGPVKPHRLDDIRLVLLGLPGAGKSSSGNSILGSERFKYGCSSNAVTLESLSGSAEVDRRRVTVVDTPGFLCKDSESFEMFNELVGYVGQAGETGLNAFVIVVPLGRISKQDCLFFKLISLIFDTSMKYLTVLFTHGDDLNGMRVKDFIESNDAMKELVSKCGGRFSVFNNKHRGNVRQVQQLFRVIDQMDSDNNGVKYTQEVLMNKWNSVKNNPAELTAFLRANGIPELPVDRPAAGSYGPPSAIPPADPPSLPSASRPPRPGPGPGPGPSSARRPADSSGPKKTSWSFFTFIASIIEWIVQKIRQLGDFSQRSSTDLPNLSCFTRTQYRPM